MFNPDLPTYFITIDEIEEGGIDLISLVENPAIMIKGLAFADETKPLINELKFNEEKQIIAGPAIIPNLPIYRYDDEIGEYYVEFTKETIEKMVEKFNQSPKDKPINLEHTSTIVPAFIKGSWIIENPELDKSRSYGFNNLPEGTWFIEVKITDKEFWEKIKKQKKTGFSIEGIMGLTLSQIKKEFEILQGGVASSNVDSYRYNDKSGELVLTFNDGSRYRYYQIDKEDFENIVLGDAMCETEGENEYGRWWIGKSPSVGAAVWKYLRDRNIRYEKLSIQKFDKISFDVDGVLTTSDGKNKLEEAIKNNDEIYIISARHNAENIYKITDEYNIPHSNIFATGSNKNKIEKIKELGIDKHYDDNSNVINELGTIGIKLNKINKNQENMKKLKFANYVLVDGTKILVEGELTTGSPVFIVTDAGAEQAAEGQYTLEDGTIIYVDAEGLINEIETAETEVVEEEDMKKDEEIKVEKYQVTPEEIMVVVNPVLDEMRMIIAELQSRIDVLEGNVPQETTQDMTKFSHLEKIKFNLQAIRNQKLD
jgi:hypothetical protein